jgi:hypothetical protein
MSISNDGKHLERVYQDTFCNKHSANKGMPCWAIEGGKPGNFVLGVCGKRVKAAGYNGKISADSVKLRTLGRRK